MAKASKAKETAKKMTSAPEKALTKAPTKAAKALLAKELTKKSAAKTAKAIPAKAGKADKKSEKIEIKATETPASENAEEEDEDMADASNGGAQSGLALAAATADTAAGSLKNFRHHPDIENFYRFIYENDLRYEALEIIDLIAVQREGMKKTAKSGKAKH